MQQSLLFLFVGFFLSFFTECIIVFVKFQISIKIFKTLNNFSR